MVLEESVTNVLSRINHRKMEKSRTISSNNPSTGNNDIQRPTEAQLRWAQFHHKTRARQVKERVERLWTTPLEVKDVDGALSDDGLSTCSDESYDSKRTTVVQRKLRPKISRGRRALLKVSQRGYERRRRLVREHGFQCLSNKENQLNVEHDEREGPKPLSTWHACSDDSRKHRFDAAYAVMNNLHSPEKPIIVTSTKRWTRPKNVQSMEESSGTNFQDWKWGLARRKRTSDSKILSRMTNMPFDRHASWLVHLPVKESSSMSRRYMYRQPLSSDGQVLEPSAMYSDCNRGDLSPGQIKFDELVSRLQAFDVVQQSNQDSVNVSGSEQVRLSSLARNHMTSTLQKHFEKNEPEARRPHAAMGLKCSQENTLRIENESLQVVRRSRSGIVDRYEECLTNQRNRVSEAHTVGSIGTVDSDFFEKARLMQDTTTCESRPGSQVFSKPSYGLRAIPETLENLFGLTRPSYKEEDTVNDHGKLRMSEAKHSSPSARGDLQGLKRQDLPTAASKSLGDNRPEGIRTYKNSLFSAIDEFSDMQTPRSQIRGKGALFDLITSSSEKSNGADNIAATSSSLRFGAVNVASGLFQIMTGHYRTSDEDESEIRALAAFRESQADRRDNIAGSTSTSSSFHVLPDGLRRIVLGKNSNHSDMKETVSSESSQKSDRLSQSFDHFHRSLTKANPPTPERLSSNRSMAKSVSPEHGILVQKKLLEDSALFGENGRCQAIIDTDDTNSETSGPATGALTAANLMMSPTILTKRHQQAVKAIERRNWDQIAYLLNANPWLAEMMEVTTQQYLLHKLALYGATKFLWSDENDAVDVIQAAPQALNEDILRMFPSAVHKFDHDGNLPLHMAAASGNIEMAILLGEHFPSGASVRNNDGMLPLHLAVQACSTPLANASGEMVYGADFVALILEFFPGAVAVPDGEGDLAIHIAATVLEGEVGVDIIYLLLDEADRQAQSDNGIRFVEMAHSKTYDDSMEKTSSATECPNDFVDDEEMHCLMVRNNLGRNPLRKAIEAGSGWQVIEALARGPGGVLAALMQDGDRCNALHLLLSEEYGDPQAALSILKIAPESVTFRNANQMLPIEVACINGMPEEVILAIVLVDSPVNLNRKDITKLKPGFGGSWWFLTCESDDQFVDLVIEVISICSQIHLRQLCYMKEGHDESGASVLARATPLCQQVLTEALTFGLSSTKGDDRH